MTAGPDFDPSQVSITWCEQEEGRPLNHQPEDDAVVAESGSIGFRVDYPGQQTRHGAVTQVADGRVSIHEPVRTDVAFYEKEDPYAEWNWTPVVEVSIEPARATISGLSKVVRFFAEEALNQSPATQEADNK